MKNVCCTTVKKSETWFWKISEWSLSALTDFFTCFKRKTAKTFRTWLQTNMTTGKMFQCKSVQNIQTKKECRTTTVQFWCPSLRCWSVCEVFLLIWHQWAALPVCLEVLNAPLTCCSLLLGLPTARPANSYWHQRPCLATHTHTHTHRSDTQTHMCKHLQANMLRRDTHDGHSAEGE